MSGEGGETESASRGGVENGAKSTNSRGVPECVIFLIREGTGRGKGRGPRDWSDARAAENAPVKSSGTWRRFRRLSIKITRESEQGERPHLTGWEGGGENIRYKPVLETKSR